MSLETECVGRNVQRIRRERGMSMGELARRSGLSKQTLSMIESGRGNPTVDTLAAIARCLGLGVHGLLTEWGIPVFLQRDGQATWQDEPERSVRELSRIYGSGHVMSSILRLSRPAESMVLRAALTPGALYHVYVVEGVARCGIENGLIEVAARDFMRFPADVPHALEAVSACCFIHLTTTLPQRPQFDMSN
jgi:transcriptional regulator with XRE-family HTH domain